MSSDEGTELPDITDITSALGDDDPSLINSSATYTAMPTPSKQSDAPHRKLHRHNLSRQPSSSTSSMMGDDTPMRPGQRMTRDEYEIQMIQQQEEEKEKLKQLMIRICHHLELKYKNELEIIIYASDPNLHYEIDVDLLSAKKHVDVRLINVPPLKEIFLDTIRNLRQYHVNKFMVIQGTVIRTSNVKNRETKKDFACRNCGKIYRASSDIYEFNRFLLPPICGGEVEKRPNPFFNLIMSMRRKKMGKDDKGGPMFQGMSVGSCNGRNFVPIHGTAMYKDYQEIKIQEVYKTLKPGVIPRSTIVILEDELVDRGKPGDDVMISGIFIQRWKPPFRINERPEIEVAFLANNVIQLNKRDFKKEINRQVCSEIKSFWKSHENSLIEGKNEIIESICPHIYERYPEKLGVLLSVIGGVQKQNENDPRIRGQIHLLMIGEPGTGKSQLLNFASKISMRSVMTTGIGTTSAGLTVALFKEGNEYIMEAGALVLADFGVCCIDEFSLIKYEDRGSIHEAMEQQTISIAKGGITCKINSRATIIAATNPSKTQKWNQRYDNAQNTNIATSLLSRFDLVFILVDTQITDIDKAQANFKLALSRQEEEEEQNKKIWNVEKISKYIVYVQRYIDPVCSEKAEMLLQAYFQYLRNRSLLGKDRKTIRMLESLIRLAEAHARLMHKNDIDIYDAICVIILMEHCVSTGLYDELPPVIMSKQIYEKAKYETLTKLGLTDYSYFEDEFDSRLTCEGMNDVAQRQPNNMGEDTAFMLETYFHNDKSDYTAAGGGKRSVSSKSHRVASEQDTVVLVDSQNSANSNKTGGSNDSFSNKGDNKAKEKGNIVPQDNDEEEQYDNYSPYGSDSRKFNLDEFKYKENLDMGFQRKDGGGSSCGKDSEAPVEVEDDTQTVSSDGSEQPSYYGRQNKGNVIQDVDDEQ